jgi:two-component system OmpR family response regulator
MNILLLDDDPAILRCMGRLLAKTDAVVLTSTIGEALAAIAACRPDVILCDVHLADASGIDFHDAVRRVDPSLASRIIFVTGGLSGGEPVLQARLNRLFNMQLMKPFRGADLRAAIASWLPSEAAA